MSSLSLFLSLTCQLSSVLICSFRSVASLPSTELKATHAHCFCRPARAPAPIRCSVRSVWQLRRLFLQTKEPSLVGVFLTANRHGQSVSPEPKPSWLPTLVAQRNPGRTDPFPWFTQSKSRLSDYSRWSS